MKIPKIIVIGASTGGVEALRVLAAGLRPDLPAAVFVVLHIGAHKSDLPRILSQSGRLSAVHPVSGEEIRAGRIYVAPPDHHMILADGFVRLTKGPRENWARPAIDPLFRSAAEVYGSGVIGVILTGGLNDGTAGLYEIKDRGGTTVVQDPAEAFDASMPRSALAHVKIDHCLPLASLPEFLSQAADGRAVVASPQSSRKRQEKEMTAEYTHHQPVAVTCPDCGGALRTEALGTITQFRCHIGHVYSAEVMLAAQFVVMERFIEAAMRSLGERRELCRQMAEKSRSKGNASDEASWNAAMQESLEQTTPLRQLLTRAWIKEPSEDSVSLEPAQ